MLIGILLLNIIGYYGVFVSMQYHVDSSMIKVLDENRYDESQTISIAIPVSVPYMADDTDFKRVDGKFEYRGEHFRMVKQKYAKDTLTVVCVRDAETKRINEALTDYLHSLTDKPSDQNQSSNLTLNFSKDYISHTVCISALSGGWEMHVANCSRCTSLIASFFSSVIHPPERA